MIKIPIRVITMPTMRSPDPSFSLKGRFIFSFSSDFRKCSVSRRTSFVIPQSLKKRTICRMPNISITIPMIA